MDSLSRLPPGLQWSKATPICALGFGLGEEQLGNLFGGILWIDQPKWLSSKFSSRPASWPRKLNLSVFGRQWRLSPNKRRMVTWSSYWNQMILRSFSRLTLPHLLSVVTNCQRSWLAS